MFSDEAWRIFSPRATVASARKSRYLNCIWCVVGADTYALMCMRWVVVCSVTYGGVKRDNTVLFAEKLVCV